MDNWSAFLRAEAAWLEPPADDEPVHECDCCGHGIFDGEEYLVVGSEKWCMDCVRDNTRTAEAQEPDWEE